MKKREENRSQSVNKKESGIVTKESFCATGALFSFLALLILCSRAFIFGALGVAIHNFLMGLFGYFAYPIVCACGYLSVMGLFGKRLVRNRKLAFCITLTILSLGLLVHTALTYKWEESGYIQACLDAGESFPKSTVMGVLGGATVYGVTRFMTSEGAIALFAVISLAFMYLARLASKKKVRDSKVDSKAISQPAQEEIVEIPVSTGVSTFGQAPATQAQQVNAYASTQPSQQPQTQQYAYTQPNVMQRPGVTLAEDPAAAQGRSFSPFGNQNDGQPVDLKDAYEYENAREFLFGGTPADNFRRNLLFDPNARVNQRTNMGSEPIVSNGYPSYSNAYENAINNAENIMPERVLRDETQNYQGYNTASYRAETPVQNIEPMQPLQRETLAPQEPVSYAPIHETREEPVAPISPSYDPVLGGREPLLDEEDVVEEPTRDSDYRRHENMYLFSTENPRVFGDDGDPNVLDRRMDEERDEDDLDYARPYTDSYEGSRGYDREDRDGLTLLDDDDEEYSTRSDYSERETEREEIETYNARDVLDTPRMGFGRELPVEETREAPVIPTTPPIAPKAEKVVNVPQSEPKKPRIIRPYVRARLDDMDCRDVEPMQNQAEVEETKETIIATLEDFKVTGASIATVTFGPTVTRYNVMIPRNISPKKVVALDQSIAISLHSSGVNVYPNYDEGVVSIEVPNKERQFVQLGCMLTGDTFVNAKPSSLMFTMGKDVANRKIYGDISKMIHMLVAGASGSGKSVFLGALIISLIYKYSPEELRLILIDPKKTEFVLYNDLPHLMINEIITDVHKTVQSLNWAIGEMNRRYELFEKMSRSGKYVTNLDQYNEQLDKNERLPKIVIIIDELADLMLAAKKEIEDRIQNLTQKARAAGIHLVVATQRPSTDVITGVIKSNLPTRIAFGVATDVDSRVILDQTGAQKLLGKGDFLYTAQGINTPIRVQSAFISPEESQRVVNFIKQNNEAYYDEEATNYINNSRGGISDDSMGGSDKTAVDSLAIEALKHVILSGSASISMIQRKCSAGYNRAGKIIEWMEDMGYISAFDGAKARKVLITKEEYESIYGPLQ